MLIILLGVEPLCLTIAKTLCKLGHDVCVISEHIAQLRILQQKADCRTIIGCPSHPHILRLADADHADMLIAATANDEMNMVACQVAYSLFNIPRKIAFISSAHYLIRHELFGDENLPIDVFINPEQVIAEQLQQMLHLQQSTFFSALPLLPFCLITTTISSQGALCHQPLSKLNEANLELNVLAIYSQQQAIVLRAETLLHTGDQILLLCRHNQASHVLKLLHGPKPTHKKIVLAASAGIVECLANMAFSKEYQIKILEPNLATCQHLAQKFPDMTILNGDLTEHEFLKEENIGHADLFCALSNDDEDNIMASLQAKELGTKQVIPMITQQHYTSIMRNTPLDMSINPNQLILGRVLSNCYHHDIKRIFLLPDQQELISLVKIKQEQPIDLWIQHDKLHLRAVIRDHKLQTFTEDESLQPNDFLIILLKSIEHITHIEDILTKSQPNLINV